MPLIDRECLECGGRFQDLVGMTKDSTIPPCPLCDAFHSKEVFTPAGSLMIGTSLMDQAIRGLDDPVARVMHQKNKDWLDSPEMQRKRATGEVTVVEAGPKEFRPAYERRVY